MQLTKDDLKVYTDYETGKQIIVIEKSKLQQVVEFYDKYSHNLDLLYQEHTELYKRWLKERSVHELDDTSLLSWLFSHCFKDGLK